MVHCKYITLAVCVVIMTACAKDSNLRKTQVLNPSQEMLPPVQKLASVELIDIARTMPQDKQKIALQHVGDQILDAAKNHLFKLVPPMQQVVQPAPTTKGGSAGFLRPKTDQNKAVAASFLKPQTNQGKVVVENMKLEEEQKPDGTTVEEAKIDEERQASLLEEDVRKNIMEQQKEKQARKKANKQRMEPDDDYESHDDDDDDDHHHHHHHDRHQHPETPLGHEEELFEQFQKMAAVLPQDILDWLDGLSEAAFDVLEGWLGLAQMVYRGGGFSEDIDDMLDNVREEDVTCNKLLVAFLTESVLAPNKIRLREGSETECFWARAIDRMVVSFLVDDKVALLPGDILVWLEGKGSPGLSMVGGWLDLAKMVYRGGRFLNKDIPFMLETLRENDEPCDQLLNTFLTESVLAPDKIRLGEGSKSKCFWARAIDSMVVSWRAILLKMVDAKIVLMQADIQPMLTLLQEDGLHKDGAECDEQLQIFFTNLDARSTALSDASEIPCFWSKAIALTRDLSPQDES